MSSSREISAGPLGVSVPAGPRVHPRPAIRRRPPAPSTGTKADNRNDFAATAPQPPANSDKPVAKSYPEGPHPAMPPMPDAGFEALMQFTEMLEQELAASERRALAHVRPRRPLSGADRKR